MSFTPSPEQIKAAKEKASALVLPSGINELREGLSHYKRLCMDAAARIKYHEEYLHDARESVVDHGAVAKRYNVAVEKYEIEQLANGKTAVFFRPGCDIPAGAKGGIKYGISEFVLTTPCNMVKGDRLAVNLKCLQRIAEPDLGHERNHWVGGVAGADRVLPPASFALTPQAVYHEGSDDDEPEAKAARTE
jgi:hypothetical protein